MNRKTLLENDDLIELIFKCLEFNPRDRMRKENLMKNRFFYTEYSETEKPSLTQNSETRPDSGEEEYDLFKCWFLIESECGTQKVAIALITKKTFQSNFENKLNYFKHK